MEPVTHGITLDAVARFVDIATDALSSAREEIDALNVYPVPDGDTGTNMFLTVSAARDELRAARAADPDLGLEAGMALLARAALMGARGNSGVILSQMLRGYVTHLAAAGLEDRRAQTIAAAMASATDASYAAVGVPVEGTILTVARAASDAALAVAEQPGARARDVFTAAAAAARTALARTPEQLAVLAQAGVVDAGGRGLTVVLDAVETTATGRRPMPWTTPIGTHLIPVATPAVPGDDLTEDGPGYEVMYLLDVGAEVEDERIGELRRTLAGLGDSLVVVGGDGLWNVHVHVDDVGAAIEAGITAGRPHRIRVTHFAEQVAAARQRTSDRTGRRVVAVAAGPGLAELFESAGAVVVEGGPGQRPSTGQLLEAITGCGAAEVVVLPNDSDTVRAAEIAARTAAGRQPTTGDANAGGRIRPRIDLDRHRPVETFHGQRRAENRLVQGERHCQNQIAPFAAEARVLFVDDRDAEIAARTRIRPAALSGDTDNLALESAARHLDRNRRSIAAPQLVLSTIHDRGQRHFEPHMRVAGPCLVAWGHKAEKRLQRAIEERPVALRLGGIGFLGARLSRSTVKRHVVDPRSIVDGRAPCRPCSVCGGLGLLERLAENALRHILRPLLRLRAAAVDVGCGKWVGRSLSRRAGWPPAAARIDEPFIEFATPVWIAEDLIGRVDFREALLRAEITGILVRMKRHGKPPEGALDLVFAGIGLNAEYKIRITHDRFFHGPRCSLGRDC